MIKRYTNPEMEMIWSDGNKYKRWLEIELLVCEAWNKFGKIPDDALLRIKERAKFDVKRIEEIERSTKHDVVAFVSCVSEYIGEDAKYIHMGLTSSDLLDTSFSLLLLEATEIILDDVKNLMETVKEKAYLYKDLPAIGRTHGVHAEPITFGLKFLVFYEELRRNLDRLYRAKEEIRFGKIKGAVGTYAHLLPEIEKYVLEKLDLKPFRGATQIILRDVHANYFTTLSILASSLERFAKEIRHLQRTEVAEVFEPFSKGQKGSSAMPHKRNPIGCENICGLARLVRGYAISSLEDIPLWHERDISHSSVERVIAPDSTTLLDFMLKRLNRILKDLSVDSDKIVKNLDITKGLIFSEAVLTKLMEKGLAREKAYDIVQRCAFSTYQNGLDFRGALESDKEAKSVLDEGDMDEIFSLSHKLRHIDRIFEEVFER